MDLSRQRHRLRPSGEILAKNLLTDFLYPIDASKVVVGNKSDLHMRREVTLQQGMSLARSFGDAPFFEVSAKTGLNISNALEELIRVTPRTSMDYKGFTEVRRPLPCAASFMLLSMLFN